MTTLVWLAASSLVWGAVLWGAAIALQSGNDLSGRARQWIWRGAAALLIMPWLAVPVVGALAPDLSGSVAPPAEFSMAPVLADAPITVAAMNMAAVEMVESAEPVIAIPWIEILFAVVIGGWLLRVVAAGRAARHLGQIIAELRPGEGTSLAIMARWSRLLGLKRAPELRVVSASTSPFSTGVSKPLVCLPEGIEQSMHAQTLDLVVGHECIHVARGDGWRRPLERSIADIMWFNPFAWAIRRELDLARELACDEAVVAASSQRKAYARTLRVVAGMAAALPASAPAASMSLSGGGRLLAMRMKRTLDAAARKPAKAAIAGAVMLAFAATPMAIAQAILIEAAQPPEPPSPPPAPPAPAAPAAVAEIAQAPLPPAAPSVAVPAQAPTPPAAPSPVDAGAPVAPVPAVSPVSTSSGITPPASVATPRPRPTSGAAAPPAPIYAPMDMRVLTLAQDAKGATIALEALATDGINKECRLKVTAVTDVKVRSGEIVKQGAIVGTRNTGSARQINCGMTFPQAMLFEGNKEWWEMASVPVARPTPTPRVPGAPVTPRPETTPTSPVAPTLERIQFTDGALKLEGAPSAVIATPGRFMSGYGYRTDPFNQNTAFHQGVDIAAPKGTEVHTPGPSVVTFAGVSGGYGRVVEVALDDDHRLRFGHLKDIAVVQGEALKAGDIVGTVGSSGRSSEPHLHLEILRNGTALDPLRVQGLTLTAGPLATPPTPLAQPLSRTPTTAVTPLTPLTPLVPTTPVTPAPEITPAPPAPSETQAGERTSRKTDLIDIDGKSVDSLPLRYGIDETWVIDNRNILYSDTSRGHYLVTLEEACKQLDTRSRSFNFFPSWSLRLLASKIYEVRHDSGLGSGGATGRPCGVDRIAQIDDARANTLRDAAQRRAW